MLVKDEEFTVEGFLSLFQKKFSNFASKSPVLISFQCDIDHVLVTEKGTKKFKDFKFDHSKSVKYNIKVIKDWLLENTYPIMIEEIKSYEDYSTDELEKIISENNIKPEQAVLMKKERIEQISWRIERILVKKDELFIRNLNTNKQFRFKLSMPSTILLKNLREKWTQTYAYSIFKDKSVILNEIYEVEEPEEE